MNGDFATPTRAPLAYLPVGTTIPGWTVVGTGNVNGHHVAQPGILWPGNPTQYFDLTGDTGGAGIQSDAFETVPGQVYRITFDALNGSLVNNAGQIGVPYAGLAFTMQVTGGPLREYDLPAGIPQALEYTFSATATNSIVTFMEGSGYDSNAGWIDNVAIAVVPEPGACGLLVAVSTLLIGLRRLP